MKIQLWSVGKQHDATVLKGVEEFTKRLQKYYTTAWQIIPPPKNAGVLPHEELLKQEGRLILAQLQPDDYLVLLDERGELISSVELAAFLQQRATESTRKIVFLIGGAFGVDTVVRQRAQFVWSFSKLVFPHMLVRFILAEQLYRACSINRNEKYHHL